MKYILIVCFLFLISSYTIYQNLDVINAYAGRTSGGFSEQARKMLYTAAIDMLKDYPLTGVGVSAFPVAINKYLDKSLGAYPEHLHNDWLELILGIGYPASIIFIFLTLSVILVFIFRIKYLRTHKKIYFIGLSSAVLSLCLASMVDFHLHIPANAYLFFLILAILSITSFYKGKVSYININLYVKIIIVIISIYLLYFSLQDTIAWRYFVFGKQLSEKSKIAHYEKGIQFSDNPRYMEKLILAYHKISFNKDCSIEEKKEFCEKTKSLSEEYLRKYPFNPKVSYIYELYKRY